MDEDLRALFQEIGEDPASLPKVTKRHHNPDQLAGLKVLSEAGRCALEQHLRRDYEIMDALFSAGLLPATYERKCPDGKMSEATAAVEWDGITGIEPERIKDIVGDGGHGCDCSELYNAIVSNLAEQGVTV